MFSTYRPVVSGLPHLGKALQESHGRSKVHQRLALTCCDAMHNTSCGTFNSLNDMCIVAGTE